MVDSVAFCSPTRVSGDEAGSEVDAESVTELDGSSTGGNATSSERIGSWIISGLTVFNNGSSTLVIVRGRERAETG